MIRNGNVELQAREEEIRFLKMQLNEEKRSIGLLRAQLPNRQSLEEEQTTLRIQVCVLIPHFSAEAECILYNASIKCAVRHVKAANKHAHFHRHIQICSTCYCCNIGYILHGQRGL